jgi:hypothetical protein
MASVWDAARTLLAMAGTEAAAREAALDLAARCRQSREWAEAAFWLAAADAVAWECNPQPMIAPRLPVEAADVSRMRRRLARRGLALPMHRSTVLRFQRELRELRDHHRARETPHPGPERTHDE